MSISIFIVEGVKTFQSENIKTNIYLLYLQLIQKIPFELFNNDRIF